MIDFLWISVVVIGATVIWPVNRWAMHRGARTESLGMCISTVATLIGVMLALVTKQALFIPQSLFFGGIAGIAHAVGFCIIIFHCLKIGPSGPTVTVNNLGLLWPVTVSVICFGNNRCPSFSILLGIGFTILALVIVGLNRSQNNSTAPASVRWIRWVLIGWVFSGISMTCQLLSSHYAPKGNYAFTVSMQGISMLLLGIVSLWKHNFSLRKGEVIAGMSTGVLMAVILPVTLLLLTRMPAAIIFPITIAGPIVLMLLISHYIFSERLNKAGWVATTFGIIGIILLSLSG